MMNAQVINTLPGGGKQSPQLAMRDAYWVAGFMVAGILGLLVLGLVFRKNVEL